MDAVFSDRISYVPRSFIREILKVTSDRSIISFAGGLPNRDLFPAQEIEKATEKVFRTFGRDVFQYSNSEGLLGLREAIARRYHEKSLEIKPEDILITNGSQQGLDLLGKIFINEGDDIIIEEPGYLGAIQAFSVFRPHFHQVTLNQDGIDIPKLKSVMSSSRPRLMYTVPNFQNPSGISYSEANRHDVAAVLKGTSTILIEDDPYGDLRFSGTPCSSFKALLPDNTILLGSFSKTVVPGFRLGWIVAPPPVMDRLIIAKQAADLHTSSFTQAIVYQYLQDNDINQHIQIIREAYGRQLQAMLESIDRYFPDGVSHTHPCGGMFVWAALPSSLSSRELLDLAIKDKVIFVPGDQFFVDKEVNNTMRLNFSCTNEETTRTGIERLGKAISRLMQEKSHVKVKPK
jgi:2-aminoadipate transaminase